MRSFLRVHQSGKARLLQGGSGQIQTIWAGADCNGNGSTIYFTGEPDGLSVDESLEQVMTKITL